MIVHLMKGFFACSGTPLGGDSLNLKGVECSPLLGGFAVVLSDGRAGFLLASSAVAKPSVCKS